MAALNDPNFDWGWFFFIDDYENILMLSFLLFSPFVYDAQVRPKVAIAN